MYVCMYVCIYKYIYIYIYIYAPSRTCVDHRRSLMAGWDQSL